MDYQPIIRDARAYAQNQRGHLIDERETQKHRNTDFLTPKEERWYRRKFIEFALELHPEMIEYV